MLDLSIRETVHGVCARERSFADHGIELRAAPNGTGGEKLTFRGYASVYDFDYPVSDWMGDYTETIARGAFKKTIADGADVPFKINHGGMSLARTAAGTLRLDANDTYGLGVEADLDPRHTDVANLRVSMERGDVNEMSFVFWPMPGGDVWSAGSTRCLRTAVNLNKGDVSVVNYGANPATAGAQLRARDFVDHPELMSESEQLRMYERLSAKFNPPSAASVLAAAVGISLADAASVIGE